MTHHGSDSGKATTFPHIVFSHSTYIPTTLFLDTLKEESRFVLVWILGTLGVSRAPKSLVEPTQRFNYVELRKVGTWGDFQH
jgi:hypothetical protein